MKIPYHIAVCLLIFLSFSKYSEAKDQNKSVVTANVFKAGFSMIDLAPEIGIPLAGYGSTFRRLKPVDWKKNYDHCFFFKPSEGIHTPIRAKVMVVEWKTQKLVFISIDVVGIEYYFVKDLAICLSEYGINKENLIVTATHTHSGPGTLSRRLPLQVIAVDLYIRENYEKILGKVIVCVKNAIGNLEPAVLYSSSFNTVGLQRNKYRKKDQEWFNPTANFLMAKSKATDLWLGGIVNFSVHGGGMPVGIMLYSSDFPGQMEIRLEERFFNINEGMGTPVILFINGAEGDVATPQRGIEHIEELGQKFISQADSAIDNLQPIGDGFQVYSKKLCLGIPALSLKYNARDNSILKKSPFLLRLCLFPVMPVYSYISFIAIGDITILTWPGEPSTELGFQLQALAKENGYMNQWIFSLANDYVGYFTTKEEFREGLYDSRSSLYNYRGGKRIFKQYNKIMVKKVNEDPGHSIN